MDLKRAVIALGLIGLPVLAVQLVKTTGWGPILATPQDRQLGDPKAKVTIFEYSDFQCPSCANIQPTVHKMVELYTGKVRVLFKYYPLTHIHRNALPAAVAAECAAAQKNFWPYQDKLFAGQASWAPLPDATTTFMSIARDLKLDTFRFAACLHSKVPREAIEWDIAEAKSRDVQATPTFFIGDERLVGNVFATDGARTIEKALRQ